MDENMSLDEVNALEEQWRNERLEDLVGVPKIMEPELDSLVPNRRDASTMLQPAEKSFRWRGKLCVDSTGGLCPLID